MTADRTGAPLVVRPCCTFKDVDATVWPHSLVRWTRASRSMISELTVGTKVNS
jgi:hypothetical protein